MNNTWVGNLNINKILKANYMTLEEDAEFMKNIDMYEVERGVEQAEREIAEGKGIEFREAMVLIHKEVFGEEI